MEKDEKEMGRRDKRTDQDESLLWCMDPRIQVALRLNHFLCFSTPLSYEISLPSVHIRVKGLHTNRACDTVDMYHTIIRVGGVGDKETTIRSVVISVSVVSIIR